MKKICLLAVLIFGVCWFCIGEERPKILDSADWPELEQMSGWDMEKGYPPLTKYKVKNIKIKDEDNNKHNSRKYIENLFQSKMKKSKALKNLSTKTLLDIFLEINQFYVGSGSDDWTYYMKKKIRILGNAMADRNEYDAEMCIAIGSKLNEGGDIANAEKVYLQGLKKKPKYITLIKLYEGLAYNADADKSYYYELNIIYNYALNNKKFSKYAEYFYTISRLYDLRQRKMEYEKELKIYKTNLIKLFESDANMNKKVKDDLVSYLFRFIAWDENKPNANKDAIEFWEDNKKVLNYAAINNYLYAIQDIGDKKKLLEVFKECITKNVYNSEKKEIMLEMLNFSKEDLK